MWRRQDDEGGGLRKGRSGLRLDGRASQEIMAAAEDRPERLRDGAPPRDAADKLAVDAEFLKASANPPCYADYNPGHLNGRINGKIGSGVPGQTPYVDVTAFRSAADYTFGNTPRELAFGSLRNAWSSNETISLMKTIPIKESVIFQFRADAFNVFNRTQFGGIDTTITDTSFGQVSTQINTPRQLQFEGYIRF